MLVESKGLFSLYFWLSGFYLVYFYGLLRVDQWRVVDVVGLRALVFFEILSMSRK